MNLAPEWVIAAAGAGWPLFRRAFWIASWGTGLAIASRDGRILDEHAAYNLGREHIVRTLLLQFWAVDWKAVGNGVFVQTRKNWRAVKDMVKRGFARDLRLVGLKKRSLTNAEDLQQGLVSAHALMDDDPHAGSAAISDQIISAQARIGVLTDPGRTLGPAEIRELQDLRVIVEAWKRDVRDDQPIARHGFVMPGLAIGSLARPLIIGGVLLTFGVVQTVRVHRVKDEVSHLKPFKKVNDDWVRAEAAWTARAEQLRAEAKALNVRCVTETKAAADRRAVQEARARAADIKARKKLNEAASQAGVAQPFDLDGRLRELAGAAEPEAAPVSGAAPADSVASGVLREGTTPAATTGGSQ